MIESYKEQAFEEFIETYLLINGGYTQIPEDEEYNRELALFPKEAIRFIKNSQPEIYEKLEAQLGSATDGAIIDALVKFLDSDEHGTLDVIRSGFKVYGKTIKMAFFKPAFGKWKPWYVKNKKYKMLFKKSIKFLSKPLSRNPVKNGEPKKVTKAIKI
ncbi:MAG TPA: hypothetical protein VGB30_04830 [bacterium]|jgi:type I restriction enzyme R subunit